MSLRRHIDIVENAFREQPEFANGWWVLPDGRVEQCPTLGSHAETARRFLPQKSEQPVAALKQQGGIRCAVYWHPNPSLPVAMCIDLDPAAATPTAKRALLKLMRDTRELFDGGYYFEHAWTERQDNQRRDFLAAIREIGGLRLTESIEDAPRFTLPAGTILYHGTESRTDFRLPRGPAWFATSKAQAQRWAGWRASDPDKGTRRVLTYRLTCPVDLYDTRRAADYYRIAAMFDTDNEPEDASPWTVAENLTGADGWYGRDEVMLRRLNCLELVASDPVPATVKSYGTP